MHGWEFVLNKQRDLAQNIPAIWVLFAYVIKATKLSLGYKPSILSSPTLHGRPIYFQEARGRYCYPRVTCVTKQPALILLFLFCTFVGTFVRRYPRIFAYNARKTGGPENRHVVNWQPHDCIRWCKAGHEIIPSAVCFLRRPCRLQVS